MKDSVYYVQRYTVCPEWKYLNYVHTQNMLNREFASVNIPIASKSSPAVIWGAQ